MPSVISLAVESLDHHNVILGPLFDETQKRRAQAVLAGLQYASHNRYVTVRLLLDLASNGPRSVSELATSVGTSNSNAHRTIRALSHGRAEKGVPIPPRFPRLVRVHRYPGGPEKHVALTEKAQELCLALIGEPSSLPLPELPGN